MTREEAIAIIENEKKCVNRANKNDYCNRDCYNCELVKTDTEILEAFDMAIKALEQTRWIPVSERLPEEPYGCLVTVEDEEPMTGQMFETILPYHVGWDGERWNDSDGEQCPFEVIAWMPLPNVYRNEE